MERLDDEHNAALRSEWFPQELFLSAVINGEKQREKAAER